MKLRLTVMVLCSFALHAWLLWAAPAQEVQAPSGTVALKLGQLKLATEMTVMTETTEKAEAPAEQKPLEKPAPIRERVNTEPVKPVKPVKKDPVIDTPVEKIPAKITPPTTDRIAAKPEGKPETTPDSAAEANASDVATAPQSTRQSVGEEAVLIERPAFASPPGAPVYPELARQRRQQGTVVVEVQIDHTGAQVVRRLLQSSGVDSLDEAALNAVESWKFLPYREDGRARHSRVRLPIRFSL